MIKLKQLLLVKALLLFFLPALVFGQPLNAPNLGACTKFALYTAVGAFSNAGTSVVTGDIGTNAGAVTGFPPGKVKGQTHVGDVVTLQAATDVVNAYNYLVAMPSAIPVGTTLGNNQILPPNVYATGAAATLNGILTLDGLGDPNALFVFQVDGAFATSTFSTVNLINGASYCNVYWQINGAYTLGDFSLFRGTIIANGAITLLTGSTLLGRGLSKVGAIDIASVVATAPVPFAIKITSNQDYLYTNESATYTSAITCGCPEDNVYPRIILPAGLTYQGGGILSGDTVTFPAISIAEDSTVEFDFMAMLNNTVITPTSLFYDGVEGADMFTATVLSGLMPSFTKDSITPLFETKSWAVGDSVFASDVVLTLDTVIAIPPSGNFSLHFNHRYLTDTMDGGVVEISINNGTTWTDAGALFTQNGYNDTLNFITDNTLINREVFTRTSDGKRESILDVSSFIGQSILFRFRFATNTGNGAALGLTGWEIDRIWLANTVPPLTLIAEAMQINISRAADTMEQNISAQPFSFGFALTCPAPIKSCEAIVNYPNATIGNNEGAVTITYSHASGTAFSNGTTTVLVNASDEGGNTATCSFDVTVNDSIPSINNLPPNVSDTIVVCSNIPVTLTGPTADEYLWYKNGVAVNYQIAPNNTYTINGGAGTNVYTLAVVHTGMPCLSAQSSPVTIVKVSPNASITLDGPASFCANSPTTLTATAGMSYYEWKRSTVTVQSGVSNTYIPTLSGNHNVRVTDINGCTKTSAWINIIVKPIPTANAGTDKNVCEGSAIQIGAASAIGNTYTWTPSQSLSNPSISNPMASPTNTTAYTLTVNNANTNCSNTDAVNVNVLGLPATPTVTSAPNGNLNVLTSNTPGAVTINWYKNGAGMYNNKQPNSTISVYSSIPTNAYTVKSKGSNGCLSNPSTAVNVRLGSDNSQELITNSEQLIVNAYPNPTEGILNIDIQNSDANEGTILLYNSLGQVVLQKNINLLDKKANEQVDISSLSEGIYTLLFLSNGKQSIVKVIKE